MSQISSSKLLQQCRNVYECYCYTPSFFSASDHLVPLPGAVILWLANNTLERFRQYFLKINCQFRYIKTIRNYMPVSGQPPAC